MCIYQEKQKEVQEKLPRLFTCYQDHLATLKP